MQCMTLFTSLLALMHNPCPLWQPVMYNFVHISRLPSPPPLSPTLSALLPFKRIPDKLIQQLLLQLPFPFFLIQCVWIFRLLVPDPFKKLVHAHMYGHALEV